VNGSSFRRLLPFHGLIEGAYGTLFAGITPVVYPSSCAVCGQETCNGTCASAIAPEDRLRQAIKKAAQRAPGDTLPDYEDEDEETAAADLDAGEL
jgi:hypothetical protein